MESTVVNFLELMDAHEGRPLPKLAWVARNILEISIWVEYCSLSEKNAHRFYTDIIHDVFDVIEAAEKASSEDVSVPDFASARAEVHKIAGRFQVANPGDPYTRVEYAAQAIGQLTEYKALNRLLSKFAHPTAMSIFARILPEQDKDFRQFIMEKIGPRLLGI